MRVITKVGAWHSFSHVDCLLGICDPQLAYLPPKHDFSLVDLLEGGMDARVLLATPIDVQARLSWDVLRWMC